MALTVGKRVSLFYRDDTNNPNMALVDGSSTPIKFSFEVDTGFVFYLLGARGVVISKGNMNGNKFGTKNPLTNGIKSYLERNQVNLIDFYDGETIQTNADWANFGVVESFGNGRAYQIGITEPSGIIVKADQRLVIEINDDMTNQNLVSLKWTLVGVIQGDGEPFDA